MAIRKMMNEAEDLSEEVKAFRKGIIDKLILNIDDKKSTNSKREANLHINRTNKKESTNEKKEADRTTADQAFILQPNDGINLG